MTSESGAAISDVRRTLAFSGTKLSLKFMWLGLLLLVGGVLVAIFRPPAMESRGGLMLILTFVLGFIIVLYATLRLILPRPAADDVAGRPATAYRMGEGHPHSMA